MIISADIENQINELEKDERKNYMEMIGLNQTGLDLLIQKGYKILELETYFSEGLSGPFKFSYNIIFVDKLIANLHFKLPI